MTKKTISIFLSLVLTFLLVREVLRLGTGDFATSIIPGWHTTIYSTEWMLSIGALIVGVICFIAFIMFKGFKKLLSRLLEK